LELPVDGVITMPGICDETSCTLVTLRSVRISGESAVTATGVVCTVALKRSDVTVISWSPPLEALAASSFPAAVLASLVCANAA
jgi:hypothetical protein